MKLLMLLAFSPALALAQLALVTYDGTNTSPVGATYNFGTIAAGDTQSVVFRVVNNSTSPMVVQAPAVSGFGFTITAVNGTTPYSIPPAPSPLNFLAFTVQFTGSLVASYSASLQVAGISTILLATVVPAPSLTIFPPCTGNNSTGAIQFGSLQNGTVHLCNLSVQNSNAQPLVISKISVTGAFQGSNIQTLPVTLAPGQATTFVIQVTPSCGTTAIQGALVVNTRSYPITGSGLDPLLPKPSITFDAQTFASGEQHALTMTLPSPAVCAVNGLVNLTFVPKVNGAVSDDAAVEFLAGSTRTLPFRTSANSTQVSINGQSSAMFQTGTTAGKITFTLSQAQINGDPTTSVVIPPATISLEGATASNQRTGELDVAVEAYDNTYSAGSMSFTFFDSSGKMIGSPMNADFTSQFKSYFVQQQNTGSAFLMRVSFPVGGNQALVGTVMATLTNAAGQVQTGSLTFQ
jgi:hypothetical protein